MQKLLQIFGILGFSFRLDWMVIVKKRQRAIHLIATSILSSSLPFSFSPVLLMLRRLTTAIKHLHAPNTEEARQALEYVHSIRHTLPAASQQLLDDGILSHIDHTATSHTGRTVLHNYLSCCTTAEARQELVVAFKILVNRFRKGNVSCARCLYPKVRCICSQVWNVEPRNKLWLLQHVGEYGRNNNTGGLLCLVAGAQRTIRGIREQQDRLLGYIERHPLSTVVVYPSQESVSLRELREERGEGKGEGMMLILLDGTSRQAKNFDRFLPRGITRVRVNEDNDRSWLNPIRRQTEEYRVCTAQGRLG